VLAVPVTLAGLIAVGMLGHGNGGLFLVAARLLSLLPMIADAASLPEAAAPD
jgi:hypothetical protein